MTRLVINTGTGANTGTGESLFSAMTKINDNFDELYTAFFGSDSAVSAITATSITARDTNGSITIGVNGSGEVILDGTVIIDQEIKSSGSAGVTIGDDLNLKGSLRFGSDQGAINSVLDEDTMASDSATALATQQSIKAYVDTELGLASTLRIVNDDSSATNINITQQTLKLKNGRDIEISMATDDITFTLSENIAVNSLESIDSSGIDINDNLTVGGNIILGDSQQLQLGDSGDLKVFHNGSHSIVRETGTGNLFLQSDNNVILSKDTGTETMVKGIADGAVELYHDNTKTFETTATGVIVGAADTNAVITTQGTGALTLSTNSGTNSGTIKINDGANGNITIENDGTGDILLKAGGQVGIGSVSSPDTSLHIKTAAAKVTLQRTADANTPGISFQQSGGNVRAEFMMDGTSGTSNTLFFKTHDGSSLSERFRVIHTGVSVTGNIDVSGATVFTPQDDLATSTTALSLSKTVHSLAAGEQNYTLAAGTEGQIMHFIIAGGDSVAGSVANTTVTISQVRNPDDGDVLATYAWKLFTTPFGAGDSVEPRRSLATCIFGNGAWNLDIYSN